MNSDNELRIRQVKTVYRQGKEVWVSEGLQSGERVCVTPIEIISEGMKVRIADRNLSKPVAWFAKNGVAANLLMGVIVISGIFSDSWLENGTLSDFDLDLVTISRTLSEAFASRSGRVTSRLKKIWDLSRDQGNEFLCQRESRRRLHSGRS